MPTGPDHASFAPSVRMAVPALRPHALASEAGAGDASEASVSVLRAAPLPSAIATNPGKASAAKADDRFQPSRSVVSGLRESRAMAALAADLVERLADASGAEFETLRTRLREVVEIGSARDTGGPLAALYAAARRDPASPLARVLSADRADRARFAAIAAEAGQELRRLDERFAERDFALTGPSVPALATSATVLAAKGVDILA